MSETLEGNIARGGNYLPSPGTSAEVNKLPHGNTDTVSVKPAANSGSKIAFPSGTRVVNVDAPGDGGKEDRD